MVSEIISHFNQNCHFSDHFHLVKMELYRKVFKDDFHVDPWNKSSQYTVNNSIGIGIPSYLLCGEQARKMEDSLPLKLFSKNVLTCILNEDDPKLFFAMLPSTLLMESIHSKSATRNQRIDCLMIGASLMILYELYKKIIKNQTFESEETAATPIPNKYQCFTTEWSSQYIMLSLSISSLLYSEGMIHLGSCGTHILEHYFGSIRRHSGGDNTHDRFMKSMIKVFVEQHLLNEFQISRCHQHRRSDSGFHVCDDPIEENNNLMHYLQIARGLLESVMDIPPNEPIYHFALPDHPFTFEWLMESYFQIEKQRHCFTSTKITGFTATGGSRNYRIWSATNQMRNFCQV